MFRVFFLCVALMFSVSARAQQWDVGLHTFSLHQHGSKLSNFDPGVYARYDGWTGGVFRNSYRRMSVYGGYTFETSTAPWSAALTVGAVTGYPAASVMPLAVPSVAFKFGDNSVRLGFVPKPPSHGTSASLHLMFEHHSTSY